MPILICVKAALILEHHDDPLLVWPQLWIDTCKPGLVRNPMHHSLVILGHQGEEALHPVINHIWSFMTIHVDAFFQHYAPPSQLNQPSPGHPF